jgi:hypothetical protein
MSDPGLQRGAGLAAVAAAAVGLAYSVSFVVIARVSPDAGAFLSALFLLAGGLLPIFALAGVYDRFRDARPALAVLALVLGAAGSLGAAVHGGYDLANVLHRPASLPGDVPNPVDPRGLLTFGVTGLALNAVAPLLPGRLRLLGHAAGVVLVVVYLARLVVLAPTSPLVLLPAALAGFVLSPLFYGLLGAWLLRAEDRSR